MAPQRIAVTTIFLCIGILLLSACGLSLRPAPRIRPVFVGGNFALYDSAHTLLARGSIYSASDAHNVAGSLTFVAPDCRKGRQIALTGTIDPRLFLRSVPNQEVDALLWSNTRPVYGANTISLLPFKGLLSVRGACAVNDLPVEAQFLPAP